METQVQPYMFHFHSISVPFVTEQYGIILVCTNTTMAILASH